MENYFDIEIGVSRKVLTALGVWPDLTAKRHLAVYVRFSFFMVLSLGFCNVPQTARLLVIENDFDEILDNILLCNLPVVITVFEMASIWQNYEALGKLLASMSDDWKATKTKADAEVMKKNAKLSRLTSVIMISVVESSVIAFLALNTFLLTRESRMFKQGQMNNSTSSENRRRPLYLSSEFPYDVQQTPYYEVTWFLQFLTTFFTVNAFAAVAGFFTSLVLHVCGQFKNLRRRFKDVLSRATREKDKINVSFPISAIVERHEYLIGFADTIEDVFNMPFLVLFISSGLVLCLSGYQIVMVNTQNAFNLLKLISAVYHCLCFASSLFIYCFIAMVLSTESVKMRETAWNSEWYNLSPSNARLLILIMIRTKKPFELTAGKFTALSLDLYCNIMKTSGGYLSMLLAVKNRLAVE